jgi:hypothetical protein
MPQGAAPVNCALLLPLLPPCYHLCYHWMVLVFRALPPIPPSAYTCDFRWLVVVGSENVPPAQGKR